jgi:hypothetical protein
MSSINDESIDKKQDSAAEVKEFFDKYLVKKISLTSNQVNAVIGFFEKRGFGKQSAVAISSVLLQQADIDGVNIFKLLDTLKGLNEVQLNNLVSTILNNNRSRFSSIGYRSNPSSQTREQRNIKV